MVYQGQVNLELVYNYPLDSEIQIAYVTIFLKLQ